MKAETADYPAKARATLKDAEQIAALPLPLRAKPTWPFST
jgi:hypothetical protein